MGDWRDRRPRGGPPHQELRGRTPLLSLPCEGDGQGRERLHARPSWLAAHARHGGRSARRAPHRVEAGAGSASVATPRSGPSSLGRPSGSGRGPVWTPGPRGIGLAEEFRTVAEVGTVLQRVRHQRAKRRGTGPSWPARISALRRPCLPVNDQELAGSSPRLASQPGRPSVAGVDPRIDGPGAMRGSRRRFFLPALRSARPAFDACSERNRRSSGSSHASPGTSRGVRISSKGWPSLRLTAL